MPERYTNLRFIIGLFFLLTSLLVLLAYLTADGGGQRINLYAGIAFLLFGGAMMFGGNNNAEK